MAGEIKGTVVAIDPSGHIVTDVTSEQLQEVPTDDRVWISCGGHRTNRIFPSDHHEPPMTYIALLGKNGKLELALVGDNAEKFLGIQVGMPVIVKW